MENDDWVAGKKRQVNNCAHFSHILWYMRVQYMRVWYMHELWWQRMLLKLGGLDDVIINYII